MARCTKGHPNGGLGTLRTSFGAVAETSAGTSVRVQSQIGDSQDKGPVWLTVVADSLAGLPLEGCRGACFYEHTAISGESVCEEVHPCRVMNLFK